jgi:Fur family peroxide stress response transcriptional regulator
MQLTSEHKELLDQAMERNGLRATRQREQVFSVLLEKRDHPTADEVFQRVRAEMDSISLATVYNCLEVLVDSRLIRQVNFEREPTRYCPNLTQHAHFYCNQSNSIIDVDLPLDVSQQLKALLPAGFEVDHTEIAFNGRSHQQAT